MLKLLVITLLSLDFSAESLEADTLILGAKEEPELEADPAARADAVSEAEASEPDSKININMEQAKDQLEEAERGLEEGRKKRYYQPDWQRVAEAKPAFTETSAKVAAREEHFLCDEWSITEFSREFTDAWQHYCEGAQIKVFLMNPECTFWGWAVDGRDPITTWQDAAEHFPDGETCLFFDGNGLKCGRATERFVCALQWPHNPHDDDVQKEWQEYCKAEPPKEWVMDPQCNRWAWATEEWGKEGEWGADAQRRCEEDADWCKVFDSDGAKCEQAPTDTMFGFTKSQWETFAVVAGVLTTVSGGLAAVLTACRRPARDEGARRAPGMQLSERNL